MRPVIILLLFSGLVTACNNSSKKKTVLEDSTAQADTIILPQQVDDPRRDSTLLALTREIFGYLKSKNMIRLLCSLIQQQAFDFRPMHLSIQHMIKSFLQQC